MNLLQAVRNIISTSDAVDGEVVEETELYHHSDGRNTVDITRHGDGWHVRVERPEDIQTITAPTKSGAARLAWSLLHMPRRK